MRSIRDEIERAFLAQLKRAKTRDDIRYVEAKAARVWWRQWNEFGMRFAGPSVPAEWGVFLAAQFSRGMQNYAIGIVTARMTRAIIAMGFDPCFGFLHDGRKPGRLSLVWDAMEPLRPKLVKAVFKYAGTHEFERRDFLVLVHKITLERTVRLAPELAKEIATVAVKAVSVSECIKTVRWLVKLL